MNEQAFVFTFVVVNKLKCPILVRYTANVCKDLQGLCGEIRVRGFQIYGDCMYTRNPCNF